MPFPKISETVADFVYAESHCGFGDGETRKIRVLSEYLRLVDANPVINKFLYDVGQLPVFAANPTVLLHVYGYAIDIYRLVEEETRRQNLKMPFVDWEIGAPIQAEFRRGSRRFISDGFLALNEENPIIIATAKDWLMPFADRGDDDAVRKIADTGYLVYCFLKRQWDADELKDQLARKIK